MALRMKQFKALEGIYAMRSYTMDSSQDGSTIATGNFGSLRPTRVGVATWMHTADPIDSLKGIDPFRVVSLKQSDEQR